MKRLQTVLKQKHVFFIIFALAVVLWSGCIAGRSDTVNTAENETQKTQQGISESEQQKTVLENIRITRTEEAVNVLLQGSRKIEYTSIKQSFPFGIAVYMPKTEFAADLTPAVPEDTNVQDILLSYADENRETAKLLILLDDNVPYSVKGLEDSEVMLKISQSSPPGVTHRELPEAPEKSDPFEMMQNTVAPSDIPQGTAELTGIEFTTNKQGYTDIDIHTSQPVRYDIRRKDKNTLVMDLVDTNIPKRHQRPFLAKYFKSAVDRLLPSQNHQNRNSKIEMELRKNVPYRVVQTQKGIHLQFEPAGVEPPEFSKAEKQLQSDTVKTARAESSQNSGTVARQQKQKEEEEEEETLEDLYDEKKEYTGRKIKLDFYETDIKNVFRILRQVSNKNFAVDKDVTGNVTLSLDQPIPWDQVLDLVLKMNGLGMTKENNVIRIATLDTLQKEENRRQQRIEAKKRELAQKKELEPLVTEYIPVNYSSASGDIKQHLDQIKSKDRGSISVDERTNMIIMTDTKPKIKQARDIINRLDKVTPQVMIKAKVVEASKDFERNLGIAWQLSSTDVYNDKLGGTYGWDASLNYPAPADFSIGYTFSRVTGTPFSLNASLTAAESKGDIKIVSSPKILTLNNKPAFIKQGLEYPYLERDDTGGSSVKFKDIDLSLEVTPQITPDDRISMQVKLTKNDVNSIVNGVPSLSTNEAETELLINNKDTIVIGGVVKNTITDSRDGLPYLSDLPLLGWAFSRNKKENKKKEILIFLTPSIVQLEQKKPNKNQ